VYAEAMGISHSKQGRKSSGIGRSEGQGTGKSDEKRHSHVVRLYLKKRRDSIRLLCEENTASSVLLGNNSSSGKLE